VFFFGIFVAALSHKRVRKNATGSTHVHVPVKEAHDRVKVKGARVETKVIYPRVETNVLCGITKKKEPSVVEWAKAEEEWGKVPTVGHTVESERGVTQKHDPRPPPYGNPRIWETRGVQHVLPTRQPS